MILFCTIYMKRGFGVSVVIDSLSRQLEKLGIATKVACVEADETFPNLEIIETLTDLDSVRTLCSALKPACIVAHSSPFFEVLPHLTDIAPVWAWEHGDPDPEFFLESYIPRGEIKTRKHSSVYPALDGVIAISNFVRAEIEWPKAQIIFNGCDHVHDNKAVPPLPNDGAQLLRVGSLMRLGAEEALYKGNPLLIQLARLLRSGNIQCSFEIMGRGTQEDKVALEAAGFKVHLNATDTERAQYLASLDVFVSSSLWEGFNLPLVEAQAQSTVGLAFDVGAHPETTPFVCRSIESMISQLQAYIDSPELLAIHKSISRSFVHTNFSWRRAAHRFLKMTGLQAPQRPDSQLTGSNEA